MGKRGIGVGMLLIAILLIAWWLLAVGEVVDVLAIEDSPVAVYAGPNRERLEIIGTLTAGQVAHVKRCIPEKSDIDLEVMVQGKVGLIQGSKIRIDRRPATLSDRFSGASTTTCHGLLRAP